MLPLISPNLFFQIEIKMKKTAAIQWEKLQGECTLSNVKHFTPSQYWKAHRIMLSFSLMFMPKCAEPVYCYFTSCCLLPNLLDQYPSSSHYTRNWDKVVGEIKEEEKNEKLEGDAALNKLFQQIYSDGSDNVKRAMNKSFVSTSGLYKDVKRFWYLFWCYVNCPHFVNGINLCEI